MVLFTCATSLVVIAEVGESDEFFRVELLRIGRLKGLVADVVLERGDAGRAGMACRT